MLQAIARPTIDHRGPEFAALMRGVLADIRLVFQTASPVVILPSSGTGAWEAALVNVTSPGDHVLMAETGHFASLWYELAGKLGLKAEMLPGSWRRGASPQAIAERLAQDREGRIKAVCVVHNETSTGAVSPIAEIRKAIDDTGHGALLMVDTISSLASIDYRRIGPEVLRRHLIEFLEAVTPAAEACGVKLTLHPDDPPRPLFGLPRVASTAQDYQALFDAVPSPANGMCFCTGSLGVRADNDLPAIARRFASRIHFTHLRATKREGDDRTFHESAHLDGDVDMVAVLKELVSEDGKRARSDKIVLRSDHGHRMLDDLDKTVTPGYPAIGRLRGLAELRGVLHALGARPD